MKRTAVAVLTAALAVSLTACGTGTDGDPFAFQPSGTTSKPASTAPDSKPVKSPHAATKATVKVWGIVSGETEFMDRNVRISMHADGASNESQPEWLYGDFEKTVDVPAGTESLWVFVTVPAGDIQCSVTVDGKTKTSRASGEGFVSCDVSMSNYSFSDRGWE